MLHGVPRSYGMNEQSASPAGHSFVPASQIESIIDTLTEIAGHLEELSLQIQGEQASVGVQRSSSSATEARVRAALLKNLTNGSESFSTLELADLANAALSYDGEGPVSESVIRKLLPGLLSEIFDAKPSCSLRRNGKYVRGYRGLAAR